ncbi:EthD domain-containing protein [Croceicoccus sp. F390]|uniref:EthD domain-containing protein n=1 Tax=Croceicoccus esteveae TaxID=3075597 RepID=A0ABU2ZFK6_9SPHN|nr:EthD domain-containing protein [Croceicoccus sp. F390]MDT0575382.1 EthD domain-containing protein [Croceicoccus sp. F390]
MKRRSDIGRDQFRHHYETHHAPLAAPLFQFSRYRRNHLIEQAVEPGFDCISEFWNESLDRVRTLMAGEVGQTMDEDERRFLDQAQTVGVLSTPVLHGADNGTTLFLLNGPDDGRDALVAALGDQDVGCEFLETTQVTAPAKAPAHCYAAMVRTYGETPSLPAGWSIAHKLEVSVCEFGGAKQGSARRTDSSKQTPSSASDTVPAADAVKSR